MIATLLEKYHGREKLLIATLLEKYHGREKLLIASNTVGEGWVNERNTMEGRG